MRGQSVGPLRLLGFLLIAVVVAGGSEAWALQSGEIALVEDSDGSINANAMTQVHLMKAACAFYKTFDDRYDALFVFTTRQLNMFTNDPQGYPVNSPSKGIGRAEASAARSFCSVPGRLRHAVKMGSLAHFTTNPDALYKGLPGYTLSAVELMGHEFGHHWLANVEYDLNDGDGRQCLLRAYIQQGLLPDPTAPRCSFKPEGDFNQHWSRRFNQNSLMYSNLIEDLGNGNFRVYRETLKYGPFDQYLMGLIEAKDVPPSFIVGTEDLTSTEGFPMGVGQQETITGTRIDVSVDDIIRRMGPRDPVSETCHWKAAFILVYDRGKPPTPQQIAIVDALRQRWESWYPTATDGRGSFDTTLGACGIGTATCPGLPDPSCAVPDCEEGAQRCASDRLPEICLANTWQEGDLCTGNTVCRDGLCLLDVPDGDSDGDSGTVVEADDSGNLVEADDSVTLVEADDSEALGEDGDTELISDGNRDVMEKDSEVSIAGDSDSAATDSDTSITPPRSGSGGCSQSTSSGTDALLVLGLLGWLLIRRRRVV